MRAHDVFVNWLASVIIGTASGFAVGLNGGPGWACVGFGVIAYLVELTKLKGVLDQ